MAEENSHIDKEINKHMELLFWNNLTQGVTLELKSLGRKIMNSVKCPEETLFPLKVTALI